MNRFWPFMAESRATDDMHVCVKGIFVKPLNEAVIRRERFFLLGGGGVGVGVGIY